MENRQQQILSEIKEMMAAIRKQIEQLDVKMAQLQNEVEPQTFEVGPIDLSLDDFDNLPFSETKPGEPVAEAAAVAEDIEEAVAEVEVAEVAEEPVAEAEPADLPVTEPVAEAKTVVAEPESIPVVKKVVIDEMMAKQAWRKDMPGAQVKDIRSAISLNDRVLFINKLFNEDPMAFQDTLTALNQMTNIDEAVNYLTSNHPGWNFESDVVYRFMMALRRKVN